MLEPEYGPEPEEDENDKIVVGNFRPYLGIPSQILWCNNSSKNIIENAENWTAWKITKQNITRYMCNTGRD